MSSSFADRLSHKPQSFSEDSLAEKDDIIKAYDRCRIMDLDAITDGDTSERKFSMCFRINEEPPIELSNLDTCTYVKLKRNDTFAEAYMNQLISDGRIRIAEDKIEAMWRSLDRIEFEPIQLSTDKDHTNGDSNELGDRQISSTQDEEIEGNPALTEKARLPITEDSNGGFALIGNRGTVNQNEDDPEIAELKRECHRHAQLDGKFFSVDYAESKLDGAIVAKCQLCPSEKNIRGTLKVLSNFSTHLKRKHSEQFDEYEEYREVKRSKVDANEAQGRRFTCKFSQSRFEENVTNYVLESMAPLRTVDMPSFRKIFDDLELKSRGVQLKHLSRRSLGRRITSNFEERMASIQTDIDKNAEFVCTTADVWSNNSRRFMGVTAHWIDSKTLQRRSMALACRRFPGTHSYDRIANMLVEIHLSFNLDAEKVLAVVTDNGSNFVKAFQKFGIDMSIDFFYVGLPINRTTTNDDDQDSASDFEGGWNTEETVIYENMPGDAQQNLELPKHFRCASHTLNLIATQDALRAIKSCESLAETHAEVMVKCTELWGITRSPKKYERLKEALGIALLKPVAVRWNSLFNALNQLISVKDNLPLAAESIGVQNGLKEKDFKYIENYLQCLRPIAEAIDKLQGEDFCHYGYLLPNLLTTARKLKGLAQKDTLQSHLPLIQSLTSGLEIRFKNFFSVEKEGELAAVAAITHPRFEAQWLGCFSTDIQEKIRVIVIRAAEKELHADDVLSPHEQNVEEAADFFDFGPSTSGFGRTSTCVRNEDPEIQIIRYTKECSTDIAVLDSYPLIRKMFIRYNTPLPSSAPVERLFCFATMMDLPKYNRLSDINFERRVLSVVNAKYERKSN